MNLSVSISLENTILFPSWQSLTIFDRLCFCQFLLKCEVVNTEPRPSSLACSQVVVVLKGAVLDGEAFKKLQLCCFCL